MSDNESRAERDDIYEALRNLKSEMWCGCMVTIHEAPWCVAARVVDAEHWIAECVKCGATWDAAVTRGAALMALVEDGNQSYDRR